MCIEAQRFEQRAFNPTEYRQLILNWNTGFNLRVVYEGLPLLLERDVTTYARITLYDIIRQRIRHYNSITIDRPGNMLQEARIGITI